MHPRRVQPRRGIAKDVPPEAHRRFRADLRAKEERDSQERAAQLAFHEEKKRFVAEWVTANGSEEQKVRQAAGVLPMAEAVEAITDKVLTPVGERPQYTRDGAERLREHLAQFPEHAGASVTPADVVVNSEHAKMASAAQWAVVEEFRTAFPEASVVLRRHRIGFKPDLRPSTACHRGARDPEARALHVAKRVSGLTLPADRGAIQNRRT